MQRRDAKQQIPLRLSTFIIPFLLDSPFDLSKPVGLCHNRSWQACTSHERVISDSGAQVQEEGGVWGWPSWKKTRPWALGNS